MDFNRNNLDGAASPYLQQHKDNPVHWQEWSEEVLAHAKKSGKLILVSVGYSTCHWCHVMAAEAFSDEEVADMLNEHFVSIKVDREQRPDLDHFFMDFAVKTAGGGGWPLNVILSPDGHPFFAGTYFPVEAKQNLPAFTDILRQVQGWHEEHGEDVKEYQMMLPEEAPVEEEKLISDITASFDEEWGGIGQTNKFPPHNTLLFLMAHYEANPDEGRKKMITKTLDMMAQRGLHDHLQGGFFRYCVDREWTIPHFEKMLYDQAMHLWVYSVAYRLFGDENYKTVVSRLLVCLQETFFDGEVLYAGHDADTNHVEGETYVWSPEDLTGLEEIFELEPNFEGKVHLVRKSFAESKGLEATLRSKRQDRPQPFVDKKVVTSWNFLTGIGLIMAARHTGFEKAKDIAFKLVDRVMKRNFVDEKLVHSSLDGKPQSEGFLEDYATLLLLMTYLYEEKPNERGKELLVEFLGKLEEFHKDGKWLMNPSVSDFHDVDAPFFDHPIPSATSLAEMARYRAQEILENKPVGEEDPTYRHALQSDFYNLFVYYKVGNEHVLHMPKPIEWKDLPLNSMRIPGPMHLDCYKKMCKMHPTPEGLLESF